MMPSPELSAFLLGYLEWVEAGAPDDLDHNPGGKYSRGYGLCSLYVWAGGNRRELEGLFKADGLDPDYPFGRYDYSRRQRHDTMHKDKNRLAWVRSVLSREV